MESLDTGEFTDVQEQLLRMCKSFLSRPTPERSRSPQLLLMFAGRVSSAKSIRKSRFLGSLLPVFVLGLPCLCDFDGCGSEVLEQTKVVFLVVGVPLNIALLLKR